MPSGVGLGKQQSSYAAMAGLSLKPSAVERDQVRKQGAAVGRELVVVAGINLVFHRFAGGGEGLVEVVGKQFGHDGVGDVLVNLHGPSDVLYVIYRLAVQEKSLTR